jgi:hypothetical protein
VSPMRSEILLPGASKCVTMRDAQSGRHLNGDVERLTHREPRGGEPSPQGLPLDVLHRDVVLALARLIERVDRAHVWVIERGRGPGLPFKPLDANRIAREVGGQELQGHRAAEAQLRREPHLTHASRTDQREDLVRANSRTRLQGHCDRGLYGCVAAATRGRSPRSAQTQRDQ